MSHSLRRLFGYRSRAAGGRPESGIRSLLLVCTGNLCRSPMAAALFASRARAGGYSLRVASAGIAAFSGLPAPEPVVSLMAARGLDISRHKAQQLTGVLARRYDLILVMDRPHQAFIEQHWSELKGRVHRLGAWRDQDVNDPYGLADESYLDCLTSIEAGVADWEPRLLSAAGRRSEWPT